MIGRAVKANLALTILIILITALLILSIALQVAGVL